MGLRRFGGRPGRTLFMLLAPVLAVACKAPAHPVPDERHAVVDPFDATEREPSFEGPRIVILGDSITAGLGIAREQAYPALLQARLTAGGYSLEVVNAGVSGDTTAGGLRRLAWVLEGDVVALLVALGGNDGLRGLPVEQMRANLAEIIVLARERGIEVVLAGMEAPPNFGGAYTAAFRQVFADLAQEHPVEFLPFLLQGVAGVPELNQPDGIHPNPAGAARIAEQLWPVVEAVARRVAPLDAHDR